MSDENKPKIIVDDDWKSRVEAEKESLRGAGSQSPAGIPPSQSATPAEQDHVEDGEFPPATFESLVSMLVTNSLVALGQIPRGKDQKPVLMLDHAKFNIDLLDMLEQKTKGNLTPSEATLISKLLHELRMVFVAVSKSGQ